MINTPELNKIYLACGSTDMRKSIDGLAALVTYHYQLDLFSESLFVFCGKRRDRLKILYWDCNGFWLYYRRLEKGKFRWPSTTAEAATIAIDRRQLRWLLDGMSTEQTQAHKAVTARLL